MNKRSVTESLRGKMINCHSAIEAVRSLPYGMPGRLSVSVHANGFTIFVKVLSPDDLKTARRMLGNSIVRDCAFGSSSGDWSLVYLLKPQCENDLFLVVQPGTVCHKVKVAETITPVYEIRCE